MRVKILYMYIPRVKVFSLRCIATSRTRLVLILMVARMYSESEPVAMVNLALGSRRNDTPSYPLVWRCTPTL